MIPELTKPQYAQDQLADLTQTLEKEKVQLTPEVEEYTRSHVRAIQDKLQVGKDVYESDLKFIEKVKMWVMMPKYWREIYPNIESMVNHKEIMNGQFEANKRHISFKQWLYLLHVTESAGKGKEWIDETFKFPGEGKIKVEGDLDLEDCTSLTSLPEGLWVEEELILMDCTSLTSLPEGLWVGMDLSLMGCTSLTSLPEGLWVGGWLSLSDCTSLALLPGGLSVGKDLELINCTSLTSLPNDISVGEDLNLSKNPNEQVKKDAERLKQEGKIKGKIKCED